MRSRNTRCENGHEYMTIAQYRDALIEDFGISISHTGVSKGINEQKIPARYIKTILGKKCINYTLSVIDFVKASPKIIPKDFNKLEEKFRKANNIESPKPILPSAKKESVKKKSKADIPESELDNTKEINLDEEPDEAEYSIALEKAKHERIKRKKAELEYKIFEGKYISLEDVSVGLDVIAVETRQAIFAIIPRLKALLAVETDAMKIGKLLDKEFTLALERLENIHRVKEPDFLESLANEDEQIPVEEQQDVDSESGE